MRYQAILFDLDGTLLPMDTDTFTHGYFRMLFRKLAKYGLDPKEFPRIMWEGVAAMVKNDGSMTNEEAFWQHFVAQTGLPREGISDDSLSFYINEFDAARQWTGANPLAAEAVRIAREKAERVVLATNPLFPMAGQITRMRWVGLRPQDFDLVTSYEAERFCKPNPMYYLSICERLGLRPADCLMIGNDECEDMLAATIAGMHGYLVTDCMIRSDTHPWHGDRGSFAQMTAMLSSLEAFSAMGSAAAQKERSSCIRSV